MTKVITSMWRPPREVFLGRLIGGGPTASSLAYHDRLIGSESSESQPVPLDAVTGLVGVFDVEPSERAGGWLDLSQRAPYEAVSVSM